MMLRRFWYPVLPVAQLDAGPSPVRLFGEDIVLWRGTDGTVSALTDRCSHQAIRLSIGEVRGNRLVCAQHRWEFDAEGRCMLSPQRASSGPRAQDNVTAYRAGSRYGLSWIALEDPVLPIPDIPEMTTPGFRVTHVLHERWRVGMLRLVEHWLDPAIRPDLLAALDLAARTWAEPKETEDGLALSLADPAAPGTHRTLRWIAPNCLTLHAVHASGLEELTLTTLAPLFERWTAVSRIHARRDSTHTPPDAEILARERAAAARERLVHEDKAAQSSGTPQGSSVTGALILTRLRRIVENQSPSLGGL